MSISLTIYFLMGAKFMLFYCDFLIINVKLDFFRQKTRFNDKNHPINLVSYLKQK